MGENFQPCGSGKRLTLEKLKTNLSPFRAERVGKIPSFHHAVFMHSVARRRSAFRCSPFRSL